MAVIPQRELRNDISSILRRVELGETFTVTVSGRAVAQLGPVPGQGQGQRALDEVLAGTRVDASWLAELEMQRADELDPPSAT